MKKLLLITMLLACSSANAGTELNIQTIKKINMGWSGEGVYIFTNENFIAEGCISGVARMPNSHLLFRENLSILLSAFHTNSKVRLYVDGCIGQQMHLKAVSIQK
jgi:hypothetical protein